MRRVRVMVGGDLMGDKLTPKQEAFALKYVECGNASEAYRTCYDVGENTKPEGIWVDACKTLAKPNVSLRVFQLQEAAAERTLVTVESLTIEYEEARKIGKDEKQSAAMSTATTGKAKLHGLLIDRQEIKAEVTHDMDAATKTLNALLIARDARK